MNASKVTISQETRAKLDNPTLDEEKKRRLRYEMVFEAIRKANSKNKKLTMQQLIVAAGFSGDSVRDNSDYANGRYHIQRMMKLNLISRNNTPKYAKVWTINNDTPADTKPVEEKNENAIINYKDKLTFPKKDGITMLTEAPVRPTPVREKSLTDQARDFAWLYNSDSLRDFVRYMESK